MIEQCISTVSFSILLDGSPFGRFFPQRGLRQGDPLSPFLFIIGLEVLSRLITKEELAGNIHSIKISRHNPSIFHLLYVDDLMVFSRANSSEASSILNCLTKFSTWSGQKVNIEKSSLFLNKNSTTTILNSIHSILKLKSIPTNAKHLGLPIFFLKNKNLASTNAKLLSQAARTTLIQTVANSILSYAMSLFYLPKSFCHNIDSILKKNWWDFPQDKSHNLSLFSWDKIYSPKAVGGLSLRSLEYQNISLLSKLGWNMLHDRGLFWVEVLVSKYLRNEQFFNSKPSPTDSWLWKGILKCMPFVQKGAC
jgi:hypothetical protein